MGTGSLVAEGDEVSIRRHGESRRNGRLQAFQFSRAEFGSLSRIAEC